MSGGQLPPSRDDLPLLELVEAGVQVVTRVGQQLGRYILADVV